MKQIFSYELLDIARLCPEPVAQGLYSVEADQLAWFTEARKIFVSPKNFHQICQILAAAM